MSDSTYVVNCFRDRWWEKWLAKGWINSQSKPVANRDLWEPLITLYLAREAGLSFECPVTQAVTFDAMAVHHRIAIGDPQEATPRRPPSAFNGTESSKRRNRRHEPRGSHRGLTAEMPA